MKTSLSRVSCTDTPSRFETLRSSLATASTSTFSCSPDCRAYRIDAAVAGVEDDQPLDFRPLSARAGSRQRCNRVEEGFAS